MLWFLWGITFLSFFKSISIFLPPTPTSTHFYRSLPIGGIPPAPPFFHRTPLFILPFLYMTDFSFNYPFSTYNLATTQVVDISCIIVNLPNNTTFSISPPLPTELSINSTNGTISGTTTFSSLSPTTTYIVDAFYNADDGDHNLNTSLIISVNFLPIFNYPLSPYIVKILSNVIIKPTYLISNTQGITYTLISSPPLSDISLNLNAVNGFITGTPDVSSNFTTYTIRANNNGIIYDTSLNISVQYPPTISYPQSVYILTQGIEVIILPVVTQTTSNVTYYLSNCELPIGLFFNSATGEISGTPTMPTTYRNYLITISNSIGSATTTLILNVIKIIIAPPVWLTIFRLTLFLPIPL